MTSEERQKLFVQELDLLCKRYGMLIKAVIQEEQLGPKKLIWAVPVLELDVNWKEDALNNNASS